jgi:NAD(P)-dependent dehydrogenase (short-subunit alcohol dehydrogenase family)
MTALRPLSNQVALVTGAGRGIGRSISRHLASLGATVILCARSASELETLAQEIASSGGNGVPLVCDVSDLSSVESAAADVRRAHARLDVLVNNAGVGSFNGPLHEMTPENWEKVLNTNLRGVFYCIRAFAPLMIQQGGGHIVNISSLAGKNPLPNGAAYAASKWGLNGLSYSVAEEQRGKNIRVSVVCPGSVDTTEGWHHGKSSNKMLQPDQIAHVVEMLVTQGPQSFVSEVLIRPTQKP